jgi:formylglycine-generating enzyme required for sulfatase activity
MAPEQVRGATSDRIDVYAFGAVLYELFARTHAICGTSPAEASLNIVNSAIDFGRLEQTNTPEPVIAFIRKCMSPQPDHRPRPDTLVEQLRTIQQQLTAASPSPPRAGIKPSLRRPLLYSTVLSCSLAVAAVVWWASTSESPTQSRAREDTGQQSRQSEIMVPPGMVLVPEGDAIVGPNGSTVRLPAFFIDKTEVTVGAYATFCPSCVEAVTDAALPITSVTKTKAQQFCASLGKRLPTGEEWEKAARGSAGFTYPWGEDRDESRASTNSDTPSRVGVFPQGASPYGALDMAGNVWEIVDRTATPTKQDLAHFQTLVEGPAPTASEPWVAVYGGSYAAKGRLNPVFDYASIPERYRDETIGFRCAQSK